MPDTTSWASVMVPARSGLVPGSAREEPAGADDDEVVDDRRPHRRTEPAAGVEDRAEHCPGAVEQHLRQEEPGEDDG